MKKEKNNLNEPSVKISNSNYHYQESKNLANNENKSITTGCTYNNNKIGALECVFF